MGLHLHDSDANLDYGQSWADWLGADTIATSAWSVTPTGPVLKASAAGSANPAGTHDTTTTTIWVSGCTVGVTYTLTNHIVTTAGRADDRSHTLRCENR